MCVLKDKLSSITSPRYLAIFTRDIDNRYFEEVNQSINQFINTKRKTITKVKWLLSPRSFACKNSGNTRADIRLSAVNYEISF